MTKEAIQIDSEKKLLAASEVVFRVENDDWAILFDPDSGETFSLNPVSVVIWKHLDGKHNIEEVKEKVHQLCVGVPADAGNHVNAFVEQLMTKNYVQYV